MGMNPFQMMMQMSGMNTQGANPMAAMMNMGRGSAPTTQKTPINETQLRNGISGMKKEDYVSLVRQARSQGIKEEDIEAGLKFLLELNKK